MTTNKRSQYRYTLISVDLASSLDEDAAYTAIVVGDVFGHGDHKKLIIRPYPINKHMEFDEIITTIVNLYNDLKKIKRTVKHIYVEDVQCQKYVIQSLKNKHRLPVVGIRPVGSKEDRLSNTGLLIQDGRVLFPEKGAELLINQLVYFGVEKFKDLADAFSMLVNEFADQRDGEFGVGAICNDGGMIINGERIPPPKQYFYFGQYHTVPIEEYYRRAQERVDRFNQFGY